MTDALSWSIILIGLLLAAFAAVSQVKKRLTRPDDFAGAGFTLGELRALHRQGKMSDEEFEKAKLTVVQAAKLRIDKEAQAGTKPPPQADPPLDQAPVDEPPAK